MIKGFAITALVLSVSGPAFAMDPTPAEARLAEKLAVEPGRYSLSELVRIGNVSGADRRDVIRVIDQQHERFAKEVQGIVDAGGDPFSVLATKNAH